MMSADLGGTYLFRQPAERQGDEKAPDLAEKQAEDNEPEEENFILCRQCRQAITRPAERISVQGSHRHTFANPHGIVFEIGCFKTVRGVGHAGPASDEFSWFAGYSWRVGFCSMCLTHLGWVFVSVSGHMFHGLILDRLLEPR
jgi:hypothetical protein